MGKNSGLETGTAGIVAIINSVRTKIFAECARKMAPRNAPGMEPGSAGDVKNTILQASACVMCAVTVLSRLEDMCFYSAWVGSKNV